jgi:hypothetical protein
MTRSLARQRWANVYIANIFGPRIPLYLAGARITEIFPVVPLIGNLTLAVAAFSYAEQLNITVVADANACPDVAIFAQGLRDSLQALSPSQARPEVG